MKNLLRITILLLCVNTFSQNVKMDLIRESLKSKRDSLLLVSLSDIIKSVNIQDNILINKYVDPQIGIFSFRDSNKKYDFIRKINFSDSIINPFPKRIITQKIIFENVSNYNCDTNKWKTTGILVDTINTHKPFSKLVRSQDPTEDSDLGITIMENNSRRIIVSQETENQFILYQGFYREKWWITFFDFRESHCLNN